ncbi:MAG: DUF4082 domain-containing protein [Bacillota bacterium]
MYARFLSTPAIAILCFLIHPALANPSPAVVDFTIGMPREVAPGMYPVAADFSSTLGWTFKAKSDLLITDLGFYDAGSPGLGVPHQVGIWTSDRQLLAHGEVPKGTTPACIGSYRYAPIDPIQLRAGETHTIGATVNQPPLVLSLVVPPPTTEMEGYPYYNIDPVSLVIDPSIEIISTGLRGDYQADNPLAPWGLTFPDDSIPDAYSFVANFRFSPVPEPAMLPLLTTGLLLLLRRPSLRRTMTGTD